MSNLSRLNYKHMYKYVTNLWVKPVCMLCQQSLPDYQRICQYCIRQLPWITEACWQCAQPLSGGQTHCGVCQKTPPPFDRLFVALDYVSPIDGLILGGKFSQRLANLSLLAELFLMHWHKQSASLPEVIIPVPLHAQRLRERGYNQALEVARLISRALNIPIDFQSVKRVKTTLAQASLPANCRRGNVQDAFALTRAINYSSVAIVDDVITTGNTLYAMSKLLLDANVKQIDVYCVARAALDPNRY